MVRRRWVAPLLTAAVLAVVGCGSAETPSGPARTPGPAATTAVPPPAVAPKPVDVAVVVEGMPADVRVGPMVNVDEDHAVLVLDAVIPDDPPLQASARPWENVPATEHHPYGALMGRLLVLDLGAGTVEEPLDVGGFTASSWYRRDEGRHVGYAAYGRQEADTVAVLVPHGDVVEVPVVDLAHLTAEGGARDPKAVLEAGQWLLEADPALGRERGQLTVQRMALEVVARDHAGTVDVAASAEGTVVRITAQALFEDGSAEPAAGSDAALDAVVAQLEERRFEEVRVAVPSGHDLPADTAHERGEAVLERLHRLTDLSGLSGAEVEAIPGGGRSAAGPERIEVHLRGAAGGTVPRIAPWGGPELPEPTGPVVAAPGPAEVELGEDAPVAVALEEVREVGDLLVGRVLVTNTGAERIRSVEEYFTRGRADDAREGSRFMRRTDAFALTVAGTRYFPVEYPVWDRYMALAPPQRQDLAPGDTYVATVVWPRVPGMSVVLDVAGREGGYRTPDVRVTDVPVR